MEMRRPFQGVWNIIRFNWQYYVLAVSAVLFLLLIRDNLPDLLRLAAIITIVLITLTTLVSLAVSTYVYDFSALYSLDWIQHGGIVDHMVNLHAGFDETSALLKSKYPKAHLTILDFYDPVLHTEVSIKRARKAYAPFPDTQPTGTSHLPLNDESIDKAFLIFAAHEIRSEKERIIFFKELYRILKPDGEVVITEHQRDTMNFLAYNIGAFHFYSKKSWLRVFNSSGFRIKNETKITPFVTSFILCRNGASS